MSFSILRTPGRDLPFQRVAKVDNDLALAIAFARIARTDVATQSVEVWENWPPRGKEKLRWLATCGEVHGSRIDGCREERCGKS